MKIRPVRAQFCGQTGLAGGQTDRHDEADSRFSRI